MQLGGPATHVEGLHSQQLTLGLRGVAHQAHQRVVVHAQCAFGQAALHTQVLQVGLQRLGQLGAGQRQGRGVGGCVWCAHGCTRAAFGRSRPAGARLQAAPSRRAMAALPSSATCDKNSVPMSAL